MPMGQTANPDSPGHLLCGLCGRPAPGIAVGIGLVEALGVSSVWTFRLRLATVWTTLCGVSTSGIDPDVT